MAHGESTRLLENPKVERALTERRLLRKLGISFFLFGVITNVLFVIVLSAAQDLLPPSIPKGVIAFCNVAPVLFIKFGWPYLLKGRIRYARRLNACWSESLPMRLLGIACAAFASAGTGAAGLIGAVLWWELRGLGIRLGVGLSSILPFIVPITYYLVLPCNTDFSCALSSPSSEDDASSELTLKPTYSNHFSEEHSIEEGGFRKWSVSLTLDDKWRIIKPSIIKYMLPVFCVYLFEFTINQGVAPTLIYPIPTPQEHPILSMFIHSLRDYYPLWQIPVFLSRSSISLGFPPLPSRLLALPAITQAFIFVVLAYEAAVGIFNESSSATSILMVFLLISVEGICGGLAYVNVFYHINQEPPNPMNVHDPERASQEKEFKIGSIGFADSSGILFASLLSVPTELKLCRTQVRRGKMLCKAL
ncbi:hypothetical protein H0H92_006662 [Tricholoma furcatifolium]|nr:hypothetical protein H0H92_006662 [Tricholoma furcatifolium]